MDFEKFDDVEKRLIARAADVEIATNELLELKAKRTEATRQITQIDRKLPRLLAERRSLDQRLKAAVGLAFFELLEGNGLNEVFRKHGIGVSETAAALRRALKEVSMKTQKSLAASIVEAIDRSLSAAQKKPD